MTLLEHTQKILQLNLRHYLITNHAVIHFKTYLELEIVS